jgi:hypothetical protein
LGYDPEDSIFQDAWMSSFTDASLDGSLDQDDEDDYTDRSMRRGERGMEEVRSSFQGKLDREKADFKRRELDAELGDEGGRNYRPASPPPNGMYFYNVRPGEERTAQLVGLKQTKNGKWYSKYPNPEAGGKFGPGKYWEPKSEGVAEDVGEGLRDPKDNPCWKGYKPVGTKKKGGKTVPNCVPTNEDPYINKLITALESKK